MRAIRTLYRGRSVVGVGYPSQILENALESLLDPLLAICWQELGCRGIEGLEGKNP